MSVLVQVAYTSAVRLFFCRLLDVFLRFVQEEPAETFELMWILHPIALTLGASMRTDVARFFDTWSDQGHWQFAAHVFWDAGSATAFEQP